MQRPPQPYVGPGYPQSAFSPEPNSQVSHLRVVAAWLAWPLVVVGTFWFVFGHAILAGGGGWMVFIGIFFLTPIYAAVAFAHALMVTFYARKLGRWAAGPWSSAAALVFVLCTALYPLAVTDFGDSGPVVQSRLTVWFGVSESTSGWITGASWYLISGVALVMIACDIIELSKINRTGYYQQPHALNPNQYQPGAPRP